MHSSKNSRGLSIIHKSRLRSRQANISREISHNTWGRKYACNICVYVCIYFIPKNPYGIAVTFEAKPSRRESASDSFSLSSQKGEEFYTLCSTLTLILLSTLGCHYTCNLMLRHCFSLTESANLSAEKREFHFESENPANSWSIMGEIFQKFTLCNHRVWLLITWKSPCLIR